MIRCFLSMGCQGSVAVPSAICGSRLEAGQLLLGQPPRVLFEVDFPLEVFRGELHEFMGIPRIDNSGTQIRSPDRD